MTSVLFFFILSLGLGLCGVFCCLSVVDILFKILFVETSWVFCVALQSLEEWKEDGCISVSVIASGHDGHFAGDADHIVVTDNGTLFDLATA